MKDERTQQQLNLISCTVYEVDLRNPNITFYGQMPGICFGCTLNARSDFDPRPSNRMELWKSFTIVRDKQSEATEMTFASWVDKFFTYSWRAFSCFAAVFPKPFLVVFKIKFTASVWKPLPCELADQRILKGNFGSIVQTKKLERIFKVIWANSLRINVKRHV